MTRIGLQVGIMMLFSQLMLGQCVNNLNISMGPLTPLVTLYAEQVLEGDISEYSDLSWDELIYNCNDLGTIPYSISGLRNGIPFNCNGTIQLEDKAPPVPIAIADLTVDFPNNATSIFLSPSLIDGGSYDNCTLDSIYTVPDSLFLSDIGSTVTVEFITVDDSDNFNSAFSDVFVSGSASPLACVDNFTVNLGSEASVTIQPTTLLTSIDPGGTYLLTIEDAAGNLVPDNVITSDYLGLQLTYIVSEFFSGNSCFGVIHVDPIGFVICDTEPRCADVTNCEQGHSLADNIEWPCDIELQTNFSGNTIDLLDLILPDLLVQDFGIDSKDAQPELFDVSELLIGMNYNDQIFDLGNESAKVIRTWTVIDWQNGTQYDYVQIISIELSSIVEIDFVWPEDITVNDIRILPEELIHISQIPVENALPSSDGEVDFIHEDEVFTESFTFYTILRKWSAISQETGTEIESNDQLIRVNFGDFFYNVSVQFADFSPVSCVDLDNEAMTNYNGLALVQNSPIENYTYTSQEEHRNANDLLALQNHILSISRMNAYQGIAADVNEDLNMTTSDLVQIERHIFGIEDLSAEWLVYDKIVDPQVSLLEESKIILQKGDIVIDHLVPAFTNGSSAYTLNVEYIEAKPGVKSYFDIYAYGHENVESLSLAFEYDPTVVAIDESAIESFIFLDGFSGTSQVQLGTISFSGAGNPFTISETSPLIRVYFDGIGQEGDVTSIDVKEFINTPLEVSSNGDELVPEVLNGRITLSDNPKQRVQRPYTIELGDRLLNAGETYSIQFALPNYPFDARTLQLQLGIDPELIESEVQMKFLGDADQEQTLEVTNGMVTFIQANGIDPIIETGVLFNQPLCEFTFKAKENSLLSKVITQSGESFLTTTEGAVYQIEYGVGEIIQTNTIDLGQESYRIYPIPANEYIVIDRNGGNARESVNYRIYDCTGNMIMSGPVNKKIDVGCLISGIYTIVLNDGIQQESKQFIKN